MNIEEAKALQYGQIVYHIKARNCDGTACRYRVTGKVKTWKRDASRVQVPVKRGLYEYGHLTEANCDQFLLYDPTE